MPIFQYITEVEYSYYLRRWVITGQCFGGILDSSNPANNKFCAMWSDDGFTWTLGDFAPGTPPRTDLFVVRSLVWSADLQKFLLGISDLALYESSDGKSWSELRPPAAGCSHCLEHFDYSPNTGRYILMGDLPTSASDHGFISSTSVTAQLSAWEPIERPNGVSRYPFEDTIYSTGMVSLCKSNTGGPNNRFDLSGQIPSPIPDPCKAATTCGECNALNEDAFDKKTNMLSTSELTCVWCGPSNEPGENNASGQCVPTLQYYSSAVNTSNASEVSLPEARPR